MLVLLGMQVRVVGEEVEAVRSSMQAAQAVLTKKDKDEGSPLSGSESPSPEPSAMAVASSAETKQLGHASSAAGSVAGGTAAVTSNSLSPDVVQHADTSAVASALPPNPAVTPSTACGTAHGTASSTTSGRKRLSAPVVRRSFEALSGIPPWERKAVKQISAAGQARQGSESSTVPAAGPAQLAPAQVPALQQSSGASKEEMPAAASKESPAAAPERASSTEPMQLGEIVMASNFLARVKAQRGGQQGWRGATPVWLRHASSNIILVSLMLHCL